MPETTDVSGSTTLPDTALVRPVAPSGSPATDFSVALLAEFVSLGVRDIVLSPGSRSQALALAATEFERLGLLRLHVRIDERGAGFLALGLAIESGRPALVVCTSGTAVANLHPAVLEAHHSVVPMILLTADRPAELRGIRSNQTTVQPGIFAEAVRLCEDVAAPDGTVGESGTALALARLAYATALGTQTNNPGPVQLNLAFREPLSAAVELEAVAAAASLPGRPDAAAPADPPHPLPPGPRTVVVAGAGAGPAAEELARLAGWPLIAEVSSGARFGPNLVVAYRELLGDADFGGQVQRVIVFGHPTLSREIPALVLREAVQTIVVAPAGLEWYNPGHRVARFARAVAATDEAIAVAGTREARAWVGRWVMASRSILAEDTELDAPAFNTHGLSKAEFAAMKAPVTRAMLADAVWRASWPHDRLVLGASRLIRELDSRVAGKKIPVHANRGLAGIDGTIATALGIALASQAGPHPLSTGTTRLLVGDVTLLHDAGSLLIAPGEVRPRLQVIVGNDGGGTIFDGLEVATTAAPSAIDRVLFTPQQVNLEALATAYGWDYARAATRSTLESALTAPVARPTLLEVPLAR
ncbi:MULTISPECIES: 2-succinyl-5-enolpyruvyl-6-hydroxy-3-cyclohexene-1-carboxylic-acid synthase [unclassified Cryobacterium]|uniref:2-succinyl-5-enolpyruvyl-6-hydroxy-3- cyclohexene-1-carboxylic-acid synthase n=1 Tax=unclassified Cryobacterium TaxID=2649013 RepID=UPI00106C6D84|nr:2-succinyl-5-enolpyruvyl-6-hydroxy-3-cyclohexene-1-carboxylic-acid synthase [Cryobacterium sp. TMB3-15]TFC74695.1 2-succinyl-5-enolpyruvyl-6-hydroxy-3-cyclohexene-1-carboxylic-acid synthase [Cryobacterium sp. TMB3-10]